MTMTSAPNPVLEKNLLAIARLSPGAAAAIRAAGARDDVEVVEAGDGSWTVRAGGRLLASRHEPLHEGRVIAEQAPVEAAACIAVIGMGAGHHVAALAERVRRTGLVLVYEPDVAMLRSLLEAHDCSGWMGQSNVVVLTSDDSASMTGTLNGMEGLLAAGVKILEHHASRARIGESAERFGRSLATVLRAVKTNVVTTFVQVETTLRNLLMNVDRYASVPGIADLEGVARGRPAVVVSAGPSLERNIDLLSREGVRERVVIIAAQTVLKKLLARGILPHFVTALDYHEISRRFYEGLTEEDVRGVTLVVEPKANPAILGAFPGVVRCPGDRVLDELLGPGLARELGTLTPGATVAHLACYLARFLGCDPVILIGQDLGFTDGQYYHAGAAIHRVWAGELNEFRTLEMMEWERIVRSRHILHRAKDHLGRPIYTDEQMATYLVQFERDFAADEARGLRTIDATEGGVAKKHTEVMTLAAALAAHGGGSRLELPEAPQAIADRARMSAVRERIAGVRRDVWKVGELSRRTSDRLAEMIEAGGDQRKVGALIDRAHALRDEVTSLRPAYGLVTFLNQMGGFKRFQADRSIDLDRVSTPLEKQKRQIERDITNVTWIADAADQLGSMLDATLKMLDGGERVTREVASDATDNTGPERGAARRRCVAVIPGHACPADLLGAQVAGGKTGLELTLARLARCGELDGVVVMRDTGGIVEGIVGSMDGDLRKRLGVELEDPDESAGEWWERAYGARRWSERCWRGGPGGLTIWDELWRPAVLARLMKERGIDAAVLVGPQWCCVDPGLTDGVILRHRENPAQHAITFSPAAPGLAPCVVSLGLAEQLAEKEQTARTFATIGGVLGYVPALARPDPIAKPPCVEASVEMRDAGWRMIADSRAGLEALQAAMSSVADVGADSTRVIAALGGVKRAVRHVVWDLRDANATKDAVQASLDSAEGGMAGAGLTIIGDRGQVADGSVLRARKQAARAGFIVQHLRLDLAVPPHEAEPLLRDLGGGEGVTVVSIDLHASTGQTYRAVTGHDGLEDAESNTRWLIRASRGGGGIGIPRLWVVPRITRREAVYEEIERFYDGWLMEAGACVIDPMPGAEPSAGGGRIRPLPRPAWVEEVDASTTRRLG